MKLIHHNVQKLNEINHLLEKLPSDLYSLPKELLSNSTVGEHIRHILEFYTCLVSGTQKGNICYDDRKRDRLIETDISYAMNTIAYLILFLGNIKCDQSLSTEVNYSTAPEEKSAVQSSLYRELAYVLDHAVHHLAIIKIGLHGDDIQMDSNFGLAPSTIRFRNSCAQ